MFDVFFRETVFEMEIEIEHIDGKFFIGDEPERAELDYYIEDSDVMRITHTFVPDSFRGQGVAKKLVLKAIEHARATGCDIKPVCSYVKAFFDRNPEHQDILV